ncbi:hypothetical protein KIPB_004293, partial [Kipferlia bialata]
GIAELQRFCVLFRETDTVLRLHEHHLTRELSAVYQSASATLDRLGIATETSPCGSVDIVTTPSDPPLHPDAALFDGLSTKVVQAIERERERERQRSADSDPCQFDTQYQRYKADGGAFPPCLGQVHPAVLLTTDTGGEGESEWGNAEGAQVTVEQAQALSDSCVSTIHGAYARHAPALHPSLPSLPPMLSAHAAMDYHTPQTDVGTRGNITPQTGAKQNAQSGTRNKPTINVGTRGKAKTGVERERRGGPGMGTARTAPTTRTAGSSRGKPPTGSRSGRTSVTGVRPSREGERERERAGPKVPRARTAASGASSTRAGARPGARPVRVAKPGAKKAGPSGSASVWALLIWNMSRKGFFDSIRGAKAGAVLSTGQKVGVSREERCEGLAKMWKGVSLPRPSPIPPCTLSLVHDIATHMRGGMAMGRAQEGMRQALREGVEGTLSALAVQVRANEAESRREAQKERVEAQRLEGRGRAGVGRGVDNPGAEAEGEGLDIEGDIRRAHATYKQRVIGRQGKATPCTKEGVYTEALARVEAHSLTPVVQAVAGMHEAISATLAHLSLLPQLEREERERERQLVAERDAQRVRPDVQRDFDRVVSGTRATDSHGMTSLAIVHRLEQEALTLHRSLAHCVQDSKGIADAKVVNDRSFLLTEALSQGGLMQSEAGREALMQVRLGEMVTRFQPHNHNIQGGFQL